MTHAKANRRGIALMIAAMGCYVLNDTFVKLTAHQLPPGQILAVRGLFATAVVAMLAWRTAAREPWRALCVPTVGARCALEVASAFFSVAALALASLAQVTAILMTAPLIIVVFATMLGWEPPRASRMLAALTGFAGALLVVRPFSPGSEAGLGSVFALLCAASLAARDLATRRLPLRVPSVLVAFLATFSTCVAGLVLGLLETWPVLGLRQVLLLALAAIFAAFGNYALIAACRGAELSVVTPFRYSIIVWAVLMSFAVWGETPDLLSLFGIALIGAAGVHAVRSMRNPVASKEDAS